VANKEGNSIVKKSRPLKYFYLNGNLHRSLHINRGADEIVAWCYPLVKRVTYAYSDVKRYKETAFSTQEVARLLNRRSDTIKKAVWKGHIPEPQSTYGLTETRKKYQWMWNEKDIMEAHAHFSSVHRGRPREDGRVTPAPIPSARELRAMIRNEEILYVEVAPGEFRPTWIAPNF
jgi:hypothetical protein